MHENVKNNAKGRVIRHTILWRAKPCKKFGGKRQKIFMEPCRVGEREKSLEKF